MEIDREFKSKVGWIYHVGLGIIAICTIGSFVQHSPVFVMIALLLGLMLAIHMLLNTWYRITADGYLVAHCSIFPEKRIKIEEITAVERSAMPVSSYALSLDRLIIYQGSHPWLLVSPTDQQEFVRCLRKFNPAIEVRN